MPACMHHFVCLAVLIVSGCGLLPDSATPLEPEKPVQHGYSELDLNDKQHSLTPQETAVLSLESQQSCTVASPEHDTWSCGADDVSVNLDAPGQYKIQVPDNIKLSVLKDGRSVLEVGASKAEQTVTLDAPTSGIYLLRLQNDLQGSEPETVFVQYKDKGHTSMTSQQVDNKEIIISTNSCDYCDLSMVDLSGLVLPILSAKEANFELAQLRERISREPILEELTFRLI